jgi:hypothetical protein
MLCQSFESLHLIVAAGAHGVLKEHCDEFLEFLEAIPVKPT